MIAFPLIRSVELKAATASSRQPPCACVPFISFEFHCTHWANILGQRDTELRSGPVSEPVVHAIDLVANLEVLEIFVDRRDDSRKFAPSFRADALSSCFRTRAESVVPSRGCTRPIPTLFPMRLGMRTLSCFLHLSVFPRHHGDESTW